LFAPTRKKITVENGPEAIFWGAARGRVGSAPDRPLEGDSCR
jgi:hypothetical protein